MERGDDSLWLCRKCGRSFGVRGQLHSCRRSDLEAHFRGKPPEVRALFDEMRRVLEECGPIRVEAVKSMIAFKTRRTVVAVAVRRDGLRCAILLPERANDRRFLRIASHGGRTYVHQFLLRCADGIDDVLCELLARAYGAARLDEPPFLSSGERAPRRSTR